MRLLLCGLAYLMICFSAYKAIAAPVVLTANEIKKLLAGNTAIGKWNGREYRQYFNADGTTIYATKNTKSSLGRWGVNYKLNTYESLWNEARWDSYQVMRDGDVLFWRDADQKQYQFKVLSGQQLVWPND